MSTEQIWVRGENGALLVFDVPPPSGIQHRLDRGDLLQVQEDGSPFSPEEEVPAPEGDGKLPDGAPELPARNASRAVWQKFAISQGMDSHKAATMGRDDLVEEFTKERGGD